MAAERYAEQRVDAILHALDSEIRAAGLSLLDQLIDLADANTLITHALDRAASALTESQGISG